MKKQKHEHSTGSSVRLDLSSTMNPIFKPQRVRLKSTSGRLR